MNYYIIIFTSLTLVEAAIALFTNSPSLKLLAYYICKIISDLRLDCDTFLGGFLQIYTALENAFISF